MNERIKLLAAQAWVDNDQLDACGYTDLEKFAELIVRECAMAADMAVEAGSSYPGDYVGEYMGYGEEVSIANWRTE